MAGLHSDAIHWPHSNAAHGIITAGTNSNPIVLRHTRGGPVSAMAVGCVGGGVLWGRWWTPGRCGLVLAADVPRHQVNQLALFGTSGSVDAAGVQELSEVLHPESRHFRQVQGPLRQHQAFVAPARPSCHSLQAGPTVHHPTARTFPPSTKKVKLEAALFTLSHGVRGGAGSWVRGHLGGTLQHLTAPPGHRPTAHSSTP